MTSKATLRLDDLRKLHREMQVAKTARVKVGVLGNKAERFDEDWNKEKKSNPQIGLENEFGVKRNEFGAETPARSWLRMPLMTRLPDKIEQIGRAVFRAIVMKKGMLVALENLGAAAENTIQQAFETGGWGQWKPLAAITIRKKKSSAILIASAQLRKAVTSKVVTGRGAAA